jgi:hypothetical protein
MSAGMNDTETVRDAEDIANAVVTAALTGDKAGIDGMLVSVSESELTTALLILGRWLADEIKGRI